MPPHSVDHCLVCQRYLLLYGETFFTAEGEHTDPSKWTRYSGASGTTRHCGLPHGAASGRDGQPGHRDPFDQGGGVTVTLADLVELPARVQPLTVREDETIPTSPEEAPLLPRHPASRPTAAR